MVTTTENLGEIGFVFLQFLNWNVNAYIFFFCDFLSTINKKSKRHILHCQQMNKRGVRQDGWDDFETKAIINFERILNCKNVFFNTLAFRCWIQNEKLAFPQNKTKQQTKAKTELLERARSWIVRVFAQFNAMRLLIRTHWLWFLGSHKHNVNANANYCTNKC